MPKLMSKDEINAYISSIAPIPPPEPIELTKPIIETARKERAEAYYNSLDFSLIKNDRVREYFKESKTLKETRNGRINRFKSIEHLRALCAVDKITTITICFKISRGGTSTNYAYMHCSMSKPIPALRRVVSFGPTFQSMDGEYRSRTVPWIHAMGLIEKYREFIEPIEVYFLNLLADNKISFQTDFYFPSIATPQNKQDLYREVEELRLPLKYWVAVWAMMFPAIHEGIEENHINDAFLKVLDHPADADKLLSKLDKVRITELGEQLSVTSSPTVVTFKNVAAVGQKIIPMTVYEAIKIDDINFNAWRELYITHRLSNLSLNGISPSFPFVISWHIIQNAHAGLFENPSMFDKFDDSNAVEAISRGLRNIDKHNYIDGELAEGPRNNKFMRLSKRIQEAIIYADSAIKLTDLAFCLFQEHIGRTLADYSILLDAEGVAPNILATLGNKATFDKIVFEFVYGFYCMNSRCGVIHGDFHLNNATIFAPYIKGAPTEMIVPSTAYSIEGEMYLFPEEGVFAGIIDQSRSILGDYEKLSAEFGDRFAELFMKDQRYRVMQIIYSYFPKFMTLHRGKMETLIDRQYPLLFKILSAVDAFVLCGNWAKLITASSHKVKDRFANTTRSILLRVARLAESLVISNMQAALDGEISGPADIEWPNLLILKECFSEYHTEFVGDLSIVDWYSAEAAMTWDAEDFDSTGPLISPMPEINLRRKAGLPPYPRWYRYVEQIQSAEQAEEFDRIIAEHENEEEEDIVRFESWMMV